MEDEGRRQVGDPAQSRATKEVAHGRTQRPRKYEIINWQCPQVSSLLVYNRKVYWSNRLPFYHSAIQHMCQKRKVLGILGSVTSKCDVTKLHKTLYRDLLPNGTRNNVDVRTKLTKALKVLKKIKALALHAIVLLRKDHTFGGLWYAAMCSSLSSVFKKQRCNL